MEKLNLLLLALMVMSHSALTDIVIQVKQEVGLGDKQPRDLEEGDGDTATDDSETEGIMTTTEGIMTTTEEIMTTTEKPCGYTVVPVSASANRAYEGLFLDCTTTSMQEALELCSALGAWFLDVPLTRPLTLPEGTIHDIWINSTKRGDTWLWKNGVTIISRLIEFPEKDTLLLVYGDANIKYRGRNSTDTTEQSVLCVADM